MNYRLTIAHLITGLLSAVLFFQAIYQLSDLPAYLLWLKFAPYIRRYAAILQYIIPITQLLIAALLWIKPLRPWLLHLALVIWLGYFVYLVKSFSKYYMVLQPFQCYWFRPGWTLITVMTLVYAWLSFIAILLYRSAQKQQVTQLQTQ